MDKVISQKILEDSKILDHLKEQSYFIKELNRNPNFYKTFIKDIKAIYKERTTDKIASAIDGVEMVSDVIDTLK